MIHYLTRKGIVALQKKGGPASQRREYFAAYC